MHPVISIITFIVCVGSCQPEQKMITPVYSIDVETINAKYFISIMQNC